MYSLASSTWDNQEINVANDLLLSGKLTMGKEVLDFEKKFANYIGTEYAVMFNSGSSANLAMIAALKYVRNSKLKEDAQILVPAVSWSTTYYPVSQLGYSLDFIDIDLNTLNIDIELLKKSITPQTKVIFAVNLLGNPCNLLELKNIADEYDLILIEDNCESLGAVFDGKMAGSYGQMSSHSFYFSHHICTMEGGMVNTDSKELMETLVSLRSHGWTRGLEPDNSVHPKSRNEWENLFRFVLPGYNLRPTELSAALGKVQLDKLPRFLEARRKNALVFNELFSGSENYKIQKELGNSSWFGFSVVLQNKLAGKRSEIIEYLSGHEIETRPIVAGNFTRNPVMKHLNHVKLPSLVNADTVHFDGFFLGNHHFEVSNELEHIHSLMVEFERKYK